MVRAKIYYKGLYKEGENSKGYYATLHYPWPREPTTKTVIAGNMCYIRTKLFKTAKACDRAVKELMEKLGLEDWDKERIK
jgi:hypothetical protein